MDPNKLTQKSQEALHDAQTKALRYGHQEVDGEHLLLALLDQPEGLVVRLFNKMDVPVENLKAEVEAEVQKRPSVTGPGTEAGKIYVTQRLNRLLMKAEEEAKRLKDEYVSVEHLILPLINEGNSTAAGRILKSFNVTTERFVSVEHLILPLINEGNATAAGRILKSFNLTTERFLQALTELRGHQRVTSATPESTYEALERYGRDLVREAKKGRLDP